MADVIRILFLLKELTFEDDKRRTFCTPSQVDIAKKTVEIITGDLSKRHSAEELATVFGVSESSLKNYCRVVFGKGYQSQSRFSKAFFKYHKVLPMEYKRRNYSAML